MFIIFLEQVEWHVLINDLRVDLWEMIEKSPQRITSQVSRAPNELIRAALAQTDTAWITKAIGKANVLSQQDILEFAARVQSKMESSNNVQKGLCNARPIIEKYVQIANDERKLPSSAELPSDLQVSVDTKLQYVEKLQSCRQRNVDAASSFLQSMKPEIRSSASN